VIVLSLTIADMSPNDTVYTMQYGKIMEEFTVPLDIWNMSLNERHKAVAAMLAHMFNEEIERKMDERPGETPEAQMLDDLMDDLEDDEDDDDEEES
jgi:hypothetical protein